MAYLTLNLWRTCPMSEETIGLLVCIGAVLLMIACWTFYIQGVRRVPESEEWYDSADANGAESDGVLFGVS